MRLAGQIKGGFYPAPAEAVLKAVDLFTAPNPACTLLDPCCGRGAAVANLGADLGIPTSGTWAIELEPERVEAARGRLAGATVVGPADFLNTSLRPSGCFGLAWVNPPFDDELGGGGRVEYSFLQRATQLLVPGAGVMLFVCPEHVARLQEVTQHFLSHYDDITITYFPQAVRHYDEVIVGGVRRKSPTDGSKREGAKARAGPGFKYTLAAAPGPRLCEKAGYTQEETLRVWGASKLRQLFDPPPPVAMPRPPLELSKGQMALVLAGGFLNTSLQRPGEPPILIKATPFKEQYVKDKGVEVRNEGTEKEKEVEVTVLSERIKLRVRVADGDGQIHDVQ